MSTVTYLISKIIPSLDISSYTRGMNLGQSLLQILSILILCNISNSKLKNFHSCEGIIPNKVFYLCIICSRFPIIFSFFRLSFKSLYLWNSCKNTLLSPRFHYLLDSCFHWISDFLFNKIIQPSIFFSA
jgi:hypothetical protein